MNSTGLVISGDTHLRPQTWQSRPDLKGDAYHSFNQIVAYCSTRKRDLLLAGDIFNSSNPDSQSVDIFREGASKLSEAGLTVYVIQGQHDAAEPPWPKAISKLDVLYIGNHAVLEPVEMLPGLRVIALDRLPPALLEETLRGLPAAGANCLVLHQLARQVFPMDGAWDFDAAWVPAHIKYLFMGDYHEQVEFDYVGGHAWYTGSTYMCSVSEEPNKSFLDVAVDKTGEIQVQRIPLETRFFAKIGVRTAEELTTAVDAIKAAPQGLTLKPLVVAEYSTAVPEAEIRLRAAAEDAHIHLWPQPISLRIDALSLESSEKGVDVTMTNCLDKFVSREDPAHTFLSELLTKSDTAAVLADWRTRMGVVQKET